MTEHERREEWLADCMRRAQRRLGIRTQNGMADEMHMSLATYQRRLRDAGGMTLAELWQLERVLSRAGLTNEAETIKRGFESS